MINESSPKILLVGPRYIDMVSSFADKTTSVKSRISLEKPNKGWHYYDELMASASTQERSPVGQSDDVAMILFTAGTTGSAKGVMLSHESFSSYIFSNVDPADPEIEERNILHINVVNIIVLLFEGVLKIDHVSDEIVTTVGTVISIHIHN